MSSSSSTRSAAYGQLSAIISYYNKILPKKSFPFIPFIIAAIFQSFAWFGGRFLKDMTLVPRVLTLWIFALGEYLFMSPTMNASTEILNYSESALVILYQAITIMVFIVINILVYKNKLTWKHVVSFILLIIAIILTYYN